VQILLDVVRPGASIADVSFLVKYLNKQIQDTKKWLGMLKTHVLIHRLLHESGDEFKSQMKKAQRWTAEDRDRDSRLKCMFSIRNWKDDNGVDASELSGWTRCYARYLEEYVEALDDIPPLGKSMGGRGGGSSRARDRSRSRDRDDRGYGRDRDRGSFDRDRDRGYGRDRDRSRSPPRRFGGGGDAARQWEPGDGTAIPTTILRNCDETELMEKLPIVQSLMRRLLDCEAINSLLTNNDIVIAGTSLILRDSFKIYRMINDGIIRLIDLFFEMGKINAMKSLEIYKRATSQGDDLERFYRTTNQWSQFRDVKMPNIENPPSSFLQTMEEYARGASAEGGGGGGGGYQGGAVAAAPARAPPPQAPPPAPAPATGPPSIGTMLGGLTVGGALAADPYQATPPPPQAQAVAPYAAPAQQSSSPTALVDPFAAPPPAVPQQQQQQQQPDNPFGANPFGAAEQPKVDVAVNLDALYAQGSAPHSQNPFLRGGGTGMQQGYGGMQQQAPPSSMGGYGMQQQGYGGMQQGPQSMMAPGAYGGAQQPGMGGGYGGVQQGPQSMMGPGGYGNGMGMQQPGMGMGGGYGAQQGGMPPPGARMSQPGLQQQYAPPQFSQPNQNHGSPTGGPSLL